jgi:hypothetical protein
MICLECATTIARPTTAQPAIGCCAYCGAGIYLDHARYISLFPLPIGVVPRPASGKRRFICTSCEVPPNGGGG